MAAVKLGPTILDLSGIRAGDTNQITFTLTKDGLPVNLSSYQISAQARKKASDIDAAITAMCQIIDPAQGTFWIEWAGNDVADLLAGAEAWSGVWDLQLTAAGARNTTIVSGKFDAVMDVTRP